MRSYGVYVNGQYIHPDGRREVRSPWSQPDEAPLQLLGWLEASRPGDAEIVEAALLGAWESQEQIHTGFFPLEERLGFLERLKQKLLAESDRISLLLTHEIGKPLQLSRTEVSRAASTIDWTIREAVSVLKPEGLAADATALGRVEGALGFALREPRGPLLAITPFNFPLNLALHKMVPALAAGCPVILKPSPKAALIGLTIADLCHSCDLPAGLLSVLNCDDETTQRMLRDPRISQVSFTGSSTVGWELARLAEGKPVHLELGGTAPAWVDATADLATAAKKLVTGAFAYAGQICISVQRIGVDKRVAGDFEALLKSETESLPWGHPTLDNVLAGPVIDAAAASRLATLRERSLESGARIVAEAGEPRGVEARHAGFLRPTLFSQVTADHALERDEIFGPYATLSAYEDFDEWCRLANAAHYRFQASVFTGRLDRGLQAARRLRYGAVCVNEPSTFRLEPMPFGGRGLSGNSREGPRYALEAFTDLKAVVLRP